MSSIVSGSQYWVAVVGVIVVSQIMFDIHFSAIKLVMWAVGISSSYQVVGVTTEAEAGVAQFLSWGGHFHGLHSHFHGCQVEGLVTCSDIHFSS